MAATPELFDHIVDPQLRGLIDQYASQRLARTVSFFKNQRLDASDRYWRHIDHRTQHYQIPREQAYDFLYFYTTRLGDPSDEFVAFTRELVARSPGPERLKTRHGVALAVDLVTLRRSNSKRFKEVTAFDQFQANEDWISELRGEGDVPGRPAGVMLGLIRSQDENIFHEAELTKQAEAALDLFLAQVPDTPTDYLAQDMGLEIV